MADAPLLPPSHRGGDREFDGDASPAAATDAGSGGGSGWLFEELTKAQPTLLVLEFSASAPGFTTRHMRRSQLLAEAHAYGAAFEGGRGAPGARDTRHRSGAVAPLLQPRDLRCVDPSFELSRQPALLVRRHSVVVNLPPIRSIVLPDKAWLLPQEGADAELSAWGWGGGVGGGGGGDGGLGGG
jgi:hypothetical protein